MRLQHRYQIVVAGFLVATLAAAVLLRSPLGAHAASVVHIQQSHPGNATTHAGTSPASCSLRYRWSVVPSTNLPVQPGDGNYLNGIIAIRPNDAWAVGTSTSGNGLIEHYPDLFQGSPTSRATPPSRATSHTVSHGPGGAILCP